MSVKLPTEQHLEFLSLNGGCTGSSESTHVEMPHCSKSHVAAHFLTLQLLIAAETRLQVLLKCLCSKKFGPSSDCSSRSSLILVHTVCVYAENSH